jgi:hypothetical protein
MPKQSRFHPVSNQMVAAAIYFFVAYTSKIGVTRLMVQVLQFGGGSPSRALV